MHNYFWRDSPTNQSYHYFSVSLVLHLLQIWSSALEPGHLLANLALSPLAILAGLLPLTFAGG